MRNRIFIFEQQVALRLGLKLNELLLLDYLYNFMQSGYMQFIYIGDEKYYKITYNKILEDLPILAITERQLRRYITHFEELQLLKRVVYSKSLYIFIDSNILFGHKLPSNLKIADKNFKDCGHGLLVIDYYDIKKIKINCESAHAIKINYQEFLELFKQNIALFTSETFYEAFIKDKLTLDEIGEDYFIFSASNVKAITSINGNKFKSAFDRTISQVLLKQTC